MQECFIKLFFLCVLKVPPVPDTWPLKELAHRLLPVLPVWEADPQLEVIRKKIQDSCPTVRMNLIQGCSLTRNFGWARAEHFLIFISFSIILSHFSLIFSSSNWSWGIAILTVVITAVTPHCNLMSNLLWLYCPWEKIIEVPIA